MLNPATIRGTENFGVGEINESLAQAEDAAKAINDFWAEHIECGPLFGEFAAQVKEIDNGLYECETNGERFECFADFKADWIKRVRQFCDQLERGGA